MVDGHARRLAKLVYDLGDMLGCIVVTEECVVVGSGIVRLLWNANGDGDRRFECWMSKCKCETVFINAAVVDVLETVLAFDGIVQIGLELLTRHGQSG